MEGLIAFLEAENLGIYLKALLSAGIVSVDDLSRLPKDELALKFQMKPVR